jgi:hypothetical protein
MTHGGGTPWWAILSEVPTTSQNLIINVRDSPPFEINRKRLCMYPVDKYVHEGGDKEDFNAACLRTLQDGEGKSGPIWAI